MGGVVARASGAFGFQPEIVLGILGEAVLLCAFAVAPYLQTVEEVNCWVSGFVDSSEIFGFLSLLSLLKKVPAEDAVFAFFVAIFRMIPNSFVAIHAFSGSDLPSPDACGL